MPLPSRAIPALVAGAALVAALLVRLTGAGLPEWIFGSVVLGFVAVVVHRGVVGARTARREARRARDLSAADPAEAARDAVRAERRRLSEDIASGLRDLLGRVADDAARARTATDPTPDLDRMHRRTQEATAELRRQIGLLREPVEPVPAELEPRPAPVRGRDGALAAGVVVLAVVESIAYPADAGLPLDVLSVVLTGLAAACVVARRSAPATAALTVGGLYLLGAGLDAPVVGGFWCLVTVCGVLWRLSATARDPRSAAAAGFLLLAAPVATRWRDPDNAALLTGLVVVAVAGGLTVRAAGARAAGARAAADSRARSIAVATGTAVASERVTFAREVHDVVSHAVGVIAVQAAAGSVSWPARPEAVHRALAVVDATVATTVDELDRLQVGRPVARTEADLLALVERIRAGGTPVDLSIVGELPGGVLDVVHRVVQESLTNVVRHARGARATVGLTAGADEVRVVVTDDGPGSTGTDRGYGLVGLGERVSFAGGTLRCGHSAGVGYVVEAVLPATREPAR